MRTIFDLFVGIISFGVFAVLQALFINGVKESMSEGNILHWYSILIARIKSDWIRKPMGDCINCMASVFGGITYWPTVVMVFGFWWQEIPLFVFDVFILVYLNFYFYKKI